MFLRNLAIRIHRGFAFILSEIAPQTIKLSPSLYLNLDSHSVELIDNRSERSIHLHRSSARTILDLASLAMSSGQIRAASLEGYTIEFDDRPPDQLDYDYTVEIDGRPPNHPMIFDNPVSWIWKPSLVMPKPTTDYMTIDIKWAAGRIHNCIENGRIEPAYAELERIDAKSATSRRSR